MECIIKSNLKFIHLEDKLYSLGLKWKESRVHHRSYGIKISADGSYKTWIRIENNEIVGVGNPEIYDTMFIDLDRLTLNELRKEIG